MEKKKSVFNEKKKEKTITKKETRDNYVKSVIDTFSAFVGLITKGVIDRFGDEGKKVVAEACSEAGKYLTKKFIEENAVTERGTEALAKVVYPEKESRYSWVDRFKFSHTQVDNENFEIKVTKCPSIRVFKDLGIVSQIPDICDILCHADEGVGMVYDSQLRLNLTKCMARGDPYCVYHWKKID